MRLSAWISVAVATLAAVVVLPAGCTQDFGRFEPLPTPTCGETEKLCNGGCVSRLNAAYGCGESCTPCAFPNAAATCVGDVCELGACNAGFANCDGADDGGNGCETSLNTTTNCGSCGFVCPGGEGSATCVNGICGDPNCPAGFMDCDDDPSNGCESELAVDAANCGACGHPCSGNGVAGDPQCQAGTCTPTCVDGFGDCSTPVAPESDNGCEINLQNDIYHCGSCDRGCSNADVASKICDSGLCTSVCLPGYANCAQPVAPENDDGCEDEVSSDDTDCGGCGNACGTLSCSFGQDDRRCGCDNTNECDGDGMNPGTGTCAQGLCTCGGTACQQGEACGFDGATSVCTCNQGAACGSGESCCAEPEGCFDLQNSRENCGACGHACAPGFRCTGGDCTCNDNDDCNAGGGGSCQGGLCVCGGTTCSEGQRCQPDGQCG